MAPSRRTANAEARYRSLFDSIDEGFCVIEILEADGHPVDYRFLETNPAFIQQTGLKNAIGRTMRELAPEHEEHWFDIYNRVAQTGEPIRFEAPAIALGKWYDVYAFRVDKPEKKRVAVLFNDITGRKLTAEKRAGAESALRESEAYLTIALGEVEQRVTERTAERDALRRRIDQAEEDERRRLSRELHDEVGQHLTAIALGLQALSDVAPPGSEIDRRASELRALAETLGRELHAIAVRLRPRALDDFGLEAAIASYAEVWSRQNGIAVEVHAPVASIRLPQLIESAVYRIIQEALTNVARHSGATRASVLLERRDGYVLAIIEDNGRGFTSPGDGTKQDGTLGIGMLGMRERAALLGGSLDIESAPSNQGTTIFVRIPITAADTALDNA